MKFFLKMIFLFAVGFFAINITAHTINAVHKPFTAVLGNWETIDENTHKPSSIISIYFDGNAVSGKIIRTFPQPGIKHITHCQSCSGDRRDQPVLGLVIIKDMQCQELRCTNGTILDPRNGNLYRASMTLMENRDFLKVRGYIGIPLFGKTVVWRRAPANLNSIKI